MRIFEPVLKHPNELFGKWLCIIHYIAGDHTRAVSITMPSSGIMGKFSTKADVCVGCKALLEANEQTVCRYCRPKIGEIYMRQVLFHIGYFKLELHNQAETNFARLWTQCQRCQGSLHQDVLCTSRDCPIFYMRKKAQKELKETSTVVSRFDIKW